MTYEEKAKEITKEYYEISELSFKSLMRNEPSVYRFYNGVLKGLAEGRKELEKENEKLSKMLEMAMTDALSQSHYAECNGSVYGLNCSNIEEYRAKLEKRVEKEE